MHIIADKMKKLGRLLRRADFLCAQNAGQKWIAKSMVVQMRPWDADEKSHGDDVVVRFGMTVSKKVHKSAVQRNRIRRQIRAIAHECLCSDKAKDQQRHDFVIVARREALEKDYEQLKRDFLWCLRRLKG